MKSSWNYKPISEIMDVLTDYVANGSFASLKENVAYSDSGFARLIRLTDYNHDFSDDGIYVSEAAYNFLSKTKLFGNEIIIANVGANVGKIFMSPNLNEPMTLGPNSILLKTKFVDSFYYYYFKSPEGQNRIQSIVTGSAQPKFNKTSFKKLIVPVPDIKEQLDIAKKLNIFDEKIKILKQINDNLLDLASTLFEDSFPNARDGENTIGTLMGNFDKQRKPLSKNQRAQRQGEYRYIGATSVVDYVDDFTFDGIYLLLGEDGTVQTYDGKPVLQYVWGPFWPNNHTHVLQGRGVSTEWLYLFWKNQNITSIITGAVQPKISQGNMNSVKVTKPSDEELATFQQKIDPIFNMIRLNTDEIENLKVIRDQLLKELLG